MANKDKRASNVKKKPQKNLKQKREARKVKKGTTPTGGGWEGGAA
jgi:hypothetical protein